MQVPASACVWITLLAGCVVLGRKQRDDVEDDGSSSAGVSRARCASRCLALHSVAALSAPLQGNGSLGWCQHHKQCGKCLEPCSDSWMMKKRGGCREQCERVFPKKPWECVTSCEFVQLLLEVKQGSCPPPEKASGFAAACVESCDHDHHCPAQKKCCSNSCGHTCQPPRDPYKGAPLKPRKELVFKELPLGPLEVRWSSRFNVSAEPVVHVLQRRWNFGIQPSEDLATPWQEVAQTTEQKAWLDDTRPGRWYQFRVAAVNSHGTRGFTTPSRHVHASREPSSPPAPSDLKVVNMTFGPGRVVSTLLQWSMPNDLDIPVHHYKVSWSWVAIGQTSASPLTRRRKTVRESWVELDSMRSNRSYSVEVQAVSVWGPAQLRGPRAEVLFITQQSTSSRLQRPPGYLLDVGTPFYQDGQLRVHVYWQSSTDPWVEFYRIHWTPECCSHNHSRPMEKTLTQESFVSLQGLLFSCKYKVVLLPVSKRSHPPAEVVTFITPSCAVVQARSSRPLLCPGEAVTLPKVLLKVANISALFHVQDHNVTAFFSWTPPQQQLIGFQVTWAEVFSTPNNQLPHGLISKSQVLPPDGNTLVVSGLSPSSLYKLEVLVIAAEGEGPATIRTFQTPGPQSSFVHRTKMRKPSL